MRLLVKDIYKYYAFSYPLFWLSGLYLIYFVPYYLWFLKRIAVRRNAVVDGFLLFFLYQFVSLVIGFFYNSEFDYFRVPNILHNMAVFLLIPTGYLVFERSWSSRLLLKKSRSVLVFLFFSFSLVFVYTYFSKTSLVLNYPWGDVYLSRVGFINEIALPRVSLFAPYVNGSAILSFLIYSVYLHKKEERRVSRIIIGLLALSIALLSGSRVVAFSISILIVLSLLRSRISLVVFLACFPVLIYLALEMNLFTAISSARAGSSETRMWIYQVGLSLMYDVNLLTGLGVKPFVDSIPNYPLGSHSTFIGYVIKGGLVSLLFLFLWFLFLVKFTADKISKVVFGEVGSLSAIATVPVAQLVFMFEDVDAYELNAFLFGFLLSVWVRKDFICEKTS